MAEPLPNINADSFYKAEQDKGKAIRDAVPTARPYFTPSPSLRNRVQAALGAFGGGVQASQAYARGQQAPDAFGSFLAGATGGIGQPSAQDIARAEAEANAKVQMEQLNATPIELVSPDIVAQHPELKGTPLGAVQHLAPFIQKASNAMRVVSRPMAENIAEAQSWMTPEQKKDLANKISGHLVEDVSLMIPKEPKKDISKTLGQQLVDGDVAPSMLPAFGAARGQAIAEAKKIDPSFNASNSELDYQRRLGSVRYESGSNVQTPVRQISGILPNLDKLKELSAKVPKSDFVTFNKYGIRAAQELGSREASDLQVLAALTADEIQAIFGRGSDKKLDLAVDLLNTAKNQQQFDSAVDIVSEALRNRQRSFLGVGGQAATTPADNSQSPVVQRTLKDGTKVNVRQLPNGKWERVP